ncbi:MAG: DUF1343 domain-containing protein [bacterium]|nr:DUF1343 domain-containing protein [bacterium]
MSTLYGLDVLGEHNFDILKGKRVGLITNYSGISSDLKSNIELMLSAGIKVIKIFTPEHGFFGASDGLEIKDTTHPKYGMKMVSLYGEKKAPTREDLEDVDILVYDIQDVGLRFYTFIYTLAYSLESASKYGISYVVLDRPNPLSGEVIIGPRILDELNSFVGGYRLPIRYGLTIGELALYYSKLKRLDLDLTIIRMKNWTRDMYYIDTGLLWNVPSPNLPTFSSTICYAGMCFIEATNISEGRGTTKPFEYIGAPWIDEDIVFEELKKENFQDIAFRKRYFIPEFSKYKGEVCRGLEFFPLNHKADFIKVALSFISIVARKFPEHFAYRTYNEVLSINLLIGDKETEKDILEGRSWREIYERWQKDKEEFKEFIEDVRLY